MRWRLLLALLLGVGVLAAVLAQFDLATVTGAMARVYGRFSRHRPGCAGSVAAS